MADDPVFSAISVTDRKRIIDRILSEIKAKRMHEEIILLETMMANDKNVFKRIFKTGEFDMVIQNQKNLACEIFGIKHTKERHLNYVSWRKWC